MKHPLDRPAWTALTSRHARFSEGGARARRYADGLPPFIVSSDDAAASLAELDRLLRPGEALYLLQADAIALPRGVVATLTADALQLVAERPLAAPATDRFLELGAADAAAMLELAELTRPGPFTADSLKLGRFWGARIDGRLVAMAGERMRQDGFTEVSGVCTHPDFRGRGLAKGLSLVAAAAIFARRDVPYLHAYTSNPAAIGLYVAIGFKVRTTMHVARVEKR